MAESAGPQITIGADNRITKIGYHLRKLKLDELPQLLNVIAGEMSLVGPRPEVPKYVAFYPESARRKIFLLRPGITDLASVEFKDESTILAKASNPETAYINEILPIKVRYYLDYAANHTIWGDLKIILLTILAIWKR